MKKTFMLLGAGLCLAVQTNAQTLDTLGEVEAGSAIIDLVVNGGRIFATAGSKVYTSTNATTWSATAPIPDFVPNDEKPRHMLIASDGSLYVAVTGYLGAAALGAGMMRTTDDGATWQTSAALDMSGYEETGRLIEMPGGRLLTYAAVGNKNYHSTLGSTTWTRATQDLMLYDATKWADTLVASTTSGMMYSVDMGDTWTALTLPASTDMGRFGSVVFLTTATHRYGGSWQNFSRAVTGSINFVDLAPNLASSTPSYYPKQIISDGSDSLFMTYTDAAGYCYVEKSADQGQTWRLLATIRSTSCFSRIGVFGTDIIGAVGSRIVRIANVATPLPPTAIVQGNAPQSKMLLSPNPATNALYVNSFTGLLRVYDMTGARQKEASINGAATLDITDLPTGIYIATGTGADGTVQQMKFIKR